MVLFVLDANIPITFDLPELNYLDGLLSMFEQTGHRSSMCRTNFLEVQARAIRSKLERCGTFQVVELDPRIGDRVRSQADAAWGSHRPGIQGPDYDCIATGVQLNADFVVSNDRKMLRVLERFRASQGIVGDKLIPTPSAAMLRLIHTLRKDLYDAKRYIIMNVDYYHYVEIPLTYDGTRNRAWTEADAVDSFTPYALNIVESMQEL